MSMNFGNGTGIRMDELVLGIDTSNYTTSLCLVDRDGTIRAEARRMLLVKSGERGLKQSEALFQHIVQFPALFRETIQPVKGNIVLVAASVRPRPGTDSYMPVFLAGRAVAAAVASAQKVPFLEVSHQEGHIAAGEGLQPVESSRFLAIHVSGGTTDVLVVNRQDAGYGIETLGSSLDLHAGQLIDRVGVALGLPFPSGRHLERLAATVSDLSPEERARIAIPAAVRGASVSFSGSEAAAMRMIAAGGEPWSSCFCRTGVHRKIAGKSTSLCDGANQWLRARWRHRLEHPAVGARLYFASPEYSTDNAYGVALLGLRWLHGCRTG
jgi:N6-L-threonylcarbamoyladenine synthase